MNGAPQAGAVRIFARSYRRAICLAAADHPHGWELVRTYERILRRMEQRGNPAAAAVLARYRQTGELPAEPVEDAQAAAQALATPEDSELGPPRVGRRTYPSVGSRTGG
jgi:hypothetical protein